MTQLTRTIALISDVFWQEDGPERLLNDCLRPVKWARN